MFKRLTGAALGLGLGMAVALPMASATELKVASFVSPMHPMHRELMQPLADAIDQATGGALTMRIYPGGELGAGPAQQYMRAVQGVGDVTFGLQGYTSSLFPRTLLIELPGTSTDPVEATNMMWNAVDLLREEYRGTEILAMWTNEPNIIMTRDKPVLSVDDLKGLKIRVPGAMMAKTVEALGATPVPMPAPKMYQALQTGVVDGLLVGSSVIRAFKIGEVANHFTIGAPLGLAAFFLVMNEGTYAGLPDDQKEALASVTGRELSLRAARAYAAAAAGGLDLMRQTDGKTVNEWPPEETARLAEILAQVRAEAIAEAEAAGVPAREILGAMGQGS